MKLLIQLATDTGMNTPHFPVAATFVYIVGLVSAVSLGSIAWYNSKRPLGWEDKERPSIIPKIETEEEPGIGKP